MRMILGLAALAMGMIPMLSIDGGDDLGGAGGGDSDPTDAPVDPAVPSEDTPTEAPAEESTEGDDGAGQEESEESDEPDSGDYEGSPA